MAKQPKLLQLAAGVDLWLGDCRAVLPKLDRVDHVITDPPYEAHMHAAKRGQKAYGAQRRIRTDGHANPKPVRFASIDGLREVVTEPLISLSRGWFIAFCTPEGIAPWRDAIEAAGAKYKRACFFIKPDSAPQFNGQGPAMAVEPFVTAWCGPGYSKWNGGGRRNYFEHRVQPTSRDGRHPTEKPFSLMIEIVTLFTDRGQTILDPFCGSGSTGIAAIRAGRKFVGIENDAASFEIARERLTTELRQTHLFVDVPKLKQTTMGFP